MSDSLFEVAFGGEIRAGEDAEDVRARVGKIFNADEKKLAQLFSGKSIVIKKNIDQQTAAKYKAALNKAGAECDIRPMKPAEPPVEPVTPKQAASETAVPEPSQKTETDYGVIAPPPQTDPLGITADQIDDLSVSIAPVGSDLKDEIREVEAPRIDTSGLDIAPVGSIIGKQKKEPDPPPPDTSGLSLEE